MSIASSYKLEIIDVANTSGSPVLGWVFTEGGMDGDLETQFLMKWQNEGEKYSVPTLVRSLGPSLTTPRKLENPFLTVDFHGSSGKDIIATNDSWTGLPNAAAISGAGLNPPSGIEAAYQAALLNDIQIMQTRGTGGFHFAGSRRARNDVIRLFETGFREYQLLKSGLQAAWISYDVSSGVNNRNVFGYSIEILQKISGLSGTEVQQSGDFFTPSELLFYSGFAYSGNCSNISLLLEQTGLTCTLPTQLEGDQPIEICLESGLNSGEMRAKIAEILQGLTDFQRRQGEINGDPIDDSAITTDNVSLRYTVYQGVIKYNNPFSGDYICVYPYVYDYTGQYQLTYGTNPPYPAQTVCFRYPQDYTSITGLVNLINTRLSGSGFNIWNRQVCLDQSNSGYFESGGLLKATLSGNTHIIIESLREGAVGRYQFTFFEADRPATGITKDNILKYMTPRKVSLQGAQTYGSWTTIDTHTNVDWPALRPTVIRDTLLDFYTGFPTGSNGQPTEAETGIIFDVSGAPVKRLVYEARITGQNNCELTFDKRVEFYESPSGFGCRESGEKDSFNKDNILTGTTGVIEKPVDYFFLKTGWKFGNTGNYNYYRIVLEDFVSDQKTNNIQLYEGFYVNGITFYGVESGTQILSGQMCLIGANYTGQIMGYTSGIISGTLTGEADASGKFCVNREMVTGQPNGNGVVMFQRTSGRATELFTGLVTQCETGTGFFVRAVDGYFWNETSNCIEFQKNVSGNITGTGTLTGGPYAIVRDSVIPTITETQLVGGTGTGILTGIIPDFSYNFTDIPAFGYLSGTWTGTVFAGDSGVLHISQVIFGVPTQAYSMSLSGTTEASAVLSYNSPASGDRVFINETVIIYDPNPDNEAPTYFKSLSELTSIINDNTGIFLATASNDGTNLYLSSILAGEEGNTVAVSAQGSPAFASTGFTGGANHYFPLNAIEPFSGQLDLDIYATGYFSISGSGFLTGSIKQLDFIRYFTGVWGLSSGDLDFQILNWVTGNANSRYQNSGFQTLPFYTGRPNAIPMLVTYNNSPLVLTNDLARLTVSGIGTETGLVMILSGQY